MNKKIFYLLLTSINLSLLVSCKTNDDNKEKPTFKIDFEDESVIVDRKINFVNTKTLTDRFISIREPSVKHDKKAWMIEYNDVPGYTNWCIAGLHFDTSWGDKKYFTDTKRITFEFNSQVSYPLVTSGYGFYIEFAWKVKTNNGEVTDADYIKYTIPFGIKKTNGEWKKGTINVDDVTAERFKGVEEDINGNMVDTDYVLEWIMVGPTWNVDTEIWEDSGRGLVMLDNICFYDTLDTSLNERAPEWGDAKVVITDL